MSLFLRVFSKKFILCLLYRVGAHAVLVGEALMRAADATVKIRQLQGLDDPPLIKACNNRFINSKLLLYCV